MDIGCKLMDSTCFHNNVIFTIGYAAFDVKEFIAALKTYKISAVTDVRSIPYSKFRADYNREALAKIFRENGIQYVYMGDSLGARFDDKSVYVNGVVDFDLAEKLESFRNGIARLEVGAKKFVIAVMCAEKDPIDCHRSILISKVLSKKFDVYHIHGDASIESHKKLENRLEKMFGFDQAVLLGNTLSLAYRKQSKKIAYSEVEHDTRN